MFRSCFPLGVIPLLVLAASCAGALGADTSTATAGETPSASADADELRLAQDGRALLPIVVSAAASDSTKAVAAQLAEYLRRITGAAFEVQTGDGATGVVLGTLAEFPHPALEEPLEVRGFDGKEAFVIRTEPERLLLIGATDLGASHAAFRFLETLGCRWFFQAKEWEVIPSRPNLAVSIDEADRPVILSRRIWYGMGWFEDPELGKHVNNSRPFLDYQSWMRHNRMASSFTPNYGHAYQTMILENQQVFDQHPEYVALVNGQRQTESNNPNYNIETVQLCISNPDVRKLAAAWALQFFEKNPQADMVSMEPSDGTAHCECEDCLAMGSVSDRVFGLANEVAKAVAEAHPGKMVGLYAYTNHSEPPSFSLEPNVFLEITNGFNEGQYSFDQLLELWPRKCRNIGVYEYYSFWPWDYDRLPGGLGGNVPYHARQIPRYAAANVVAIDAESGNNWGPHGRGYYIANKLMWDPQADVEALLSDFYEKAFGPAAPPMKRYYERFDPGNAPLMSVHLLAAGFRDIDDASRLAVGHPDVQARLDQLKRYMRYMHLRWQLDRESDAEKKKELTLATLTHVFRSRYDYMNHWRWMQTAWASNAAQEFNEPTWDFSNPADKPWSGAGPYTHEETQELFREGLEYFPPAPPVDEKEFSRDLMPVTFEGTPPVASRQQYQDGAPYALYSVQGEPLVMSIVTSTTTIRNKPPATYAINDADGAKIAEGKLQLDNSVKHRLEIQVPGPGLYYLKFDDSGTGWQLEVEPDRPVTLMLDRERGYLHAGHMQPMYFYVPTGTREIQYYWDGLPHEVFGPDGKMVSDVTESGRFIIIPVPEGMDGQPWHFEKLALGRLWFFNIPNYLAASPNALLLPREVVETDGLRVRGGEGR